MQAPIQATRRPARGRQDVVARRRQALAAVLLALVTSVAANVVQVAWHLAYAADAETAMAGLRQRVRDAEAETEEAQRALASRIVDDAGRVAQD